MHCRLPTSCQCALRVPGLPRLGADRDDDGVGLHQGAGGQEDGLHLRSRSPRRQKRARRRARARARERRWLLSSRKRGGLKGRDGRRRAPESPPPPPPPPPSQAPCTFLLVSPCRWLPSLTLAPFWTVPEPKNCWVPETCFIFREKCPNQFVYNPLSYQKQKSKR